MAYFCRFSIQDTQHIAQVSGLKTQPETRDPFAYDVNPIIQGENAVIERIMEIILHAGLASHQAQSPPQADQHIASMGRKNSA